MEAIKRTPQANDQLKPFQFRPSKTRLITNDTMEKLADGKYPKNSGVRTEFTNDDISSYVGETFAYASAVSLNTYLSLFADPIKDGLSELLANRGSLTTFTNSSKAYTAVTPGKMRYVGDLTASFNYQSLIDMMGADFTQDIKTYALDPSDAEYYSHKKLALVKTGTEKDPRYFSMIGSYNFTVSSATKNSELIVLVDDPRAYEYHQYRNRLAITTGQAQLITLDKAKVGAAATKRVRTYCTRFFQTLFEV
jgi:hypothetical protein